MNGHAIKDSSNKYGINESDNAMDVNANSSNTNGGRISHTSGAMAFASDGGNYKYQRIDGDTSSSVCVIL